MLSYSILLENIEYAINEVVKIENAVKYSPACAEVQVSLESTDGQIYL